MSRFIAKSSEDCSLEPTAGAERHTAQQRLFDVAVWLGLIACILVVYLQTNDFEFINYDTSAYVENPHAAEGFTPATIKWAFTNPVVSNWLPLTLLSHVLDVQLFGMESGWHHLMNVLYHSLAALLLFAALRRATGARGPSAFVAFIFAVHPLHVESVAWIAERKDVLCALFWFLTLYLYVRYSERPSARRYVAFTAAFCLGLMSKPMIVTLPFTLLLFDFWPLRRQERAGADWRALIWEKVPLFLLTAAVCVVTYHLQTKAMLGAPLSTRAANAVLSYATYIRQTLWPSGLAIFYPYPKSMSIFSLAGAAVMLLAGMALAISWWRTKPYFTVGWLWFLGTLVPTIGLVQVGLQAHADRYMYVPMVGLLVMLAWGTADILARWERPQARVLAGIAGAALCVACLALARNDAGYWRSSEALFQRDLAVTGPTVLGEDQLGDYFMEQHRPADATIHYQAAVAIDPTNADQRGDLGAALMDLEGCSAAKPELEIAAQEDPSLAMPEFDLGICGNREMDYAAAARYFEAAIRLKPDFANAHVGLAMSLSKIPGRTMEAQREYEIALRIRPRDGKTHAELGMLLASLGRGDEAIEQLEKALQLDPLSDPEIELTLDRLRLQQQTLHHSDDR